MSNIYAKFGLIFVTLSFGFTSCKNEAYRTGQSSKGSAVTSAEQLQRAEYSSSFSQLPTCDFYRDGEVRFVADVNQYYVCKQSSGEGWIVASLKGEKGDKGDQGDQGERGLQGAQGLRGEQGIQGERGLQGAQGLRGEQGIRGERGLQGAQGLRGEQGIQGDQGIQGAQGIQGTQGLRGEQGIAGIDGKDSDSRIDLSDASSTECANGGVVVTNFKDQNGDDAFTQGVDKLISNKAICNGEAGLGGGISISTEEVFVDAFIEAAGDTTAGIRAALAHASNSRKCLAFRTGVTYKTGQITVSRDVGIPSCINGNGASLVAESGTVSVLFLNNPHIFANRPLFYVDNLKIDATGAEYALHIKGAQRIRVSNIKTTGASKAGLYLVGGPGYGIYYNEFSSIYSLYDHVGVEMVSEHAQAHVNDNTFLNVNAAYSTDVGMRLNTVNSLSFTGGSVEASGSHALELIYANNTIFNGFYIERHGYIAGTSARNPDAAAFKLERYTQNFKYHGRVSADEALTAGLLTGDAVNYCYSITSSNINKGVTYSNCMAMPYKSNRWGEFNFDQEPVSGGAPIRTWGFGVIGDDRTNLDGSFYLYRYGASAGYKMVIDRNGYLGLGLGSTSPARTLHIKSLMRLEPIQQAPANAGIGDVFMHSSGALCVFTGQAWEKTNESGTCY